jgi:hypothetical protein
MLSGCLAAVSRQVLRAGVRMAVPVGCGKGSPGLAPGCSWIQPAQRRCTPTGSGQPSCRRGRRPLARARPPRAATRLRLNKARVEALATLVIHNSTSPGASNEPTPDAVRHACASRPTRPDLWCRPAALSPRPARQAARAELHCGPACRRHTNTADTHLFCSVPRRRRCWPLSRDLKLRQRADLDWADVCAAVLHSGTELLEQNRRARGRPAARAAAEALPARAQQDMAPILLRVYQASLARRGAARSAGPQQYQDHAGTSALSALSQGSPVEPKLPGPCPRCAPPAGPGWDAVRLRCSQTEQQRPPALPRAPPTPRRRPARRAPPPPRRCAPPRRSAARCA